MTRAVATNAYLFFALERQRYAIRLSAIDGVESPRAIRAVPGAPPHVLGLAHWRGRLLTVVDLPGIVDDDSSGGTPSLLRLAAPHAGLALFLPAPTWIGHLQTGEASEGSIAWEGRSHRLLLPDELVAQACRTEAGSA